MTSKPQFKTTLIVAAILHVALISLLLQRMHAGASSDADAAAPDPDAPEPDSADIVEPLDWHDPGIFAQKAVDRKKEDPADPTPFVTWSTPESDPESDIVLPPAPQTAAETKPEPKLEPNIEPQIFRLTFIAFCRAA